MKNILIVNYNTTLLTQCCIKSVNKFTPGCKIYVFDNSDKEPFVNIFKNVEVIDNTKGQIINWEIFLEKYPNRFNSSAYRNNNYASAKHCYTIQKCFDLINDNFILLDSDTLLKKDITELYDERYIYVADNEPQYGCQKLTRVIPYCCFINVKKCKELNINYFNEQRMHGLYYNEDGDNYDTGSNFYVECEKFCHKDIKYEDYIEHFHGGSWGSIRQKQKITCKQWLNKNKNLWQGEGDDENNITEDKSINNLGSNRITVKERILGAMNIKYHLENEE